MKSIPERTAPNVCPPTVAPLALAALLLFSPAPGATEPSPGARPPARWSLEVVSGPSLGGPVGDLGAGPTAFGSAEGYRNEVDGRHAGVWVEAEASIVTLAPMARLEATRALRLGGRL